MAEKYEKLSVVGNGAFGQVWKAKHRSTKEFFAIKEVSLTKHGQQGLDLVVGEVKILQDCHHANIIRYIEFFIQSNSINIVMEFANGGDLHTRIRNQQKENFREPVIMDWFVQICFAFRYIHSLHIIHRDVKASNIFLTGRNQIKVGDFGVSRVLKGPEDLATTLIGTPYYFSPEICRNEPYNRKSDMWALGCVLYELCSLEGPFQGSNLLVVMANILQGSPKPIPSTYSRALRGLVSALLRADSENRLEADQLLRSKELREYVVPYLDKTAEVNRLRMAERQPPARCKSAKRRKVAPAIGIDLGTSNSCVAVFNNGKVDIICNEIGHRITPSYVAFTGTERLIGEAAKNQAGKNAKNTVFDAKRLIGHNFMDSVVQADMKSWPFEVKSKGDKPVIKVEYKGEEKTIYPEEISAMVLTKMKETAEAFLGNKVQDAVITVPAYFNDAQRQATKDAGAISGLNVLSLLNEPTAAAIAYGIDKKVSKAQTTLIFDLGGGTFDVSIVAIENGFFDVKSTAGNSHLGGGDFDDRIARHCAEEFMRLYKKDITSSKRSMNRLHKECEKAKHALSASKQVNIQVDALFEGIDFEITLSRNRFDDLCKDLCSATLEPVKQALSDANLDKSQIDDILLVGGSTRILKIQQLLQDFFGGKDLNKGINADEAVAYGAAIAAARHQGSKSESVKDMVLLNVTPLSLGVEVGGDRMSVLIKRNTTIPTKKIMNFCTSTDKQSEAKIAVYEGEHDLTRNNHLLGMFNITGIPPAPKGVPQIEITFDIDNNNLLTVSAMEKDSGHQGKLTIKNTDYLSQQNINDMVQDAEKYREEDEAEDERVSARGELEKLLFKLKSDVNEATNLGETSKKKIVAECNQVLSWIDSNQLASKEEYVYKANELYSACKAIAAEKQVQDLFKMLLALAIIEGVEGSNEDSSDEENVGVLWLG